MMLYRLLSRLPLGVLYALSRMFFWLMRDVFRYRRAVVRGNLRRAFPDAPAARIRELSAGFYRELADVAAETVKLASLDARDVRRRVQLDNPEILDEAGGDRPVLLLSAHFGNWEWLLQSCMLSLGWPMFAVHKPQRLGAGAFINDVRARFGAVPVRHREVGREVVRRRRRRCLFAVVADQEPKGARNACWTPLFGRPTAFSSEVARLAAMFRTPVFFVAAERCGRGHYRARFERLGVARKGKEDEFIRAYAAAVERCIRRRPQGWLWSHRRWKHAPPDGA